MNNELLFNCLGHDGFFIINKKIFKTLGWEFAIILSNFVDKYRYFQQQRWSKDGWFYLTEKEQKKELNISYAKIRSIRKYMTDLKLISCKKHGMPAKMYYKIRPQKILELLSLSEDQIQKKYCPEPLSTENSQHAEQTKIVETTNSQQERKKIANILLDNNKTKTKTKEEKSKPHPSLSSNQKPSNPSMENQTKKKTAKKKLPKRCIEFSKEFYEQLSRNGGKKKYSPVQILKGAETVDKLIRIDRYDLEEEIIPCLEWGLQDEFWSRQLQSLIAIRSRSKNGDLKFNNMFNVYSTRNAKYHKSIPGRGQVRARPGEIDGEPDIVITGLKKIIKQRNRKRKPRNANKVAA